MAEDLYGNICTVQQEMRKIRQQEHIPADAFNFGVTPCDQEMIMSYNQEEEAGRHREGPRSNHCTLYFLGGICLVLLITGVCFGAFKYFQISAEVQKVDSDVSSFKAQVSGPAHSALAQKMADLESKLNTLDTNISNAIKNLESLLRSEVVKINSQAEKTKEDLRQNIQNVDTNISNAIKNVESLLRSEDSQHSVAMVKLETLLKSEVVKINSQGEKTKEDLQQNIQNVGKDVNSQVEKKMRDLENTVKISCKEKSGWRKFGGRCYYFSQSFGSWATARQSCVAMDSTLAMVKTEEQRAFLASIARAGRYWLGLNDIGTEGIWKWLDGSSADNSNGLWNPGEPNNSGEEDCGEMKNEKLNDEPCHEYKPWICERRDCEIPSMDQT